MKTEQRTEYHFVGNSRKVIVYKSNLKNDKDPWECHTYHIRTCNGPYKGFIKQLVESSYPSLDKFRTLRQAKAFALKVSKYRER